MSAPKLLAIIICLLLTTHASYAQTTTPNLDNTFRVRLLADPLTFDWSTAHTEMETPIISNIMEGLYQFDSELRLRPALASGYELKADQKTYIFKIRPGIVWSDGKPLRAQDFIFSWTRLLEPSTASAYAYLLFGVEGAKNFNGRKGDKSQLGLRVIDDLTFEVKLEKPVSYFLQLTAVWPLYPMREDVIHRHGSQWTRVGRIVTLGPYRLKEHVPNAQIILERNDTYHGQRPKIAFIEFRIINEDSTALRLFENGQVDLLRPINFLELGKLEQSPNFHKQSYLRVCYLNFNTSKFPFNLPKFRQAISHAIDKSQIVKALHRDIEPAHAFVPTNLLKPTFVQPFSLPKALELMKDTGLETSTLGKIDLNVYSSDENTLLAQALQSQLKKHLNLNIEINMQEYKLYRTHLELKMGSMYMRCWKGDYPDADSFLEIFTSHSGTNRTNWKNSEYDQLIETASATLNQKERIPLYNKAQELLLKDHAVIVPLYNESASYLLNSRIKDFKMNSINFFDLRRTTITPTEKK